MPPLEIEAASALPIQGPRLWLKADAITGLTDGTPVATWPDSSGLNINATQSDAGKRPIYKTNVAAGNPAVRFDGANDVLTTSLSAALKPVSIFAVVYIGTPMTATGTPIGASHNGGLQVQVAAPASDPAKGAGNFNLVKQQIVSIGSAQAEIPRGARLITVTYDTAGNYRMWLDGQPVGSGTRNEHFDTSTYWIGGNGSNGEFFSRDIGEIFVYDVILSAADRRSVEDYLKEKWKIVAVPLGQTLGSGGGLHTANSSGYQSDPVNSATGNYFNSVTDVSLPGIGLPFEFSRSYNSADTSQGPLGPGWTHNYATSLTVAANGDVTLRAEDGQRVFFQREPNGSFTSPYGGRSTLTTVTGGYELLRLDQVRYRFDSSGRLTEQRDRNGNTISFSYDGSSRLSQATDTAGRVIAFSYNGNGLLSGLSLPDGRSVSYTYTAGRLTSVTDLRSKTTSYSYDGNGRLSEITDARGNALVRNTYAANGRVSSQLDALGNESTFAWDTVTETSTMTDARGNAWKDVYSSNVLIRRIDPLGNTTEYGYDAEHNRTSITDPLGKTTTMTYDDRGNLLTRVAPAPLSYEEIFTYDAKNNLLSARDGRGNTTTYEYDTAGNRIKMTEPGNVVTQYGRATSGLLTSVTNPRGKTTLLEYDTSGNLVKKTSPMGFVTTMAYDSAGRMTSMVDPRGNVTGANPNDYKTTYTYDAAGNLLSQTDPLGNSSSWTYDAVGNRASQTDALNRTTNYAYNAANRLTSVTAPDTTVTAYAYDAVGNLTSRTDAKNHTTTYVYDVANRLTSVTSPTGQEWTNEYDANGNRTKTVMARGNATPAPGDGTVTFTYDALSRRTGIDYSDTTPDVTFAYDAVGNRTSMIDGAGTQTFTYDTLNRLTNVTRGADTFAYAYDATGNVTRRTYPDSTVVDYVYDDDGRLGSVTAGAQSTSYTYDPAGNITQTTLPTGNGFVERRTYDHAGRVTEIRNEKGAATLSRFTYTLDPVGNPTTVTTTSGTETYTHDALDRLTEVCYQASCPGPADPYIRWTYDAVGNRLTEGRLPVVTTTYSYNAADQLASRTGLGGTVNYSYDDDGNQTAAGARTFTYDLANRLVSTTNAGATTTYAYDGDGKRLTASPSSSSTRYLWDANAPLAQLALERDGSGALLRRYIHGADLISMTNPAGSFYYHYGTVGSVANLTDAAGALQWSYAYEPFGALRSEVQEATGAPTNLMRFTGELHDADTGLYHLRARQYDPTTGRFLATDPLTPVLTDPYVAAYVYVANRPTVLVDPSGEWGLPGAIVGGIVGAVAGGVQAAATGGDWRDVLAGAAAGGATGALAGAVPAYYAIRAGAFLGGLGDLASQSVSQYTRTGSVRIRDINWLSIMGSGLGGYVGARLGVMAATQSRGFTAFQRELLGYGVGFVPGLNISIAGGLLGMSMMAGK